MSGALLGRNTENSRIVLRLLESVERDSAQSQRRLAAERRYAYYLTPSGFAEKARLTLEYLSYSFDLFRRAKADCTTVLLAANARGFHEIVLAGVSELAEIAIICAYASRGRPNHRVGGLAANEIKGVDGLV